MRLCVSSNALHAFTLYLGVVCTAVIRENPALRDPLAAKSGHDSDQKADSIDLLLIREDLGIGKPSRIVDGDVGFFEANAERMSQAPFSREPVTDAVKPEPAVNASQTPAARC